MAGDFYFTRSGGTQCTGVATTPVSDNTVTVVFAPTSTCPVSDAQRAGTVMGALPGGAAADPGNPSTPSGVIVPASATSTGTGTTAAPDLTKVVVDPTDKTSLDFTFDKEVAPLAPAGFHAVVSPSGSSAVLTAMSASVINASATSTTIRAGFGAALSFASEYVVKGAVDGGAVVETSPPFIANVADALPSGGNAGAFSRGFTTGPDVTAGIINTTTGVLSLNVDQRVFPGAVNPTTLILIDGTGFDVTPTGSSGITVPTQGPGPETIQAQFTPGQASVAKNAALTFGGSPFTGGFTIAALLGVNVPQVLHITSTASILHGLKHAKKQSAASVRKVNARSRAKNRAAVARLIRRHH